MDPADIATTPAEEDSSVPLSPTQSTNGLFAGLQMAHGNDNSNSNSSSNSTSSSSNNTSHNNDNDEEYERTPKSSNLERLAVVPDPSTWPRAPILTEEPDVARQPLESTSNPPDDPGTDSLLGRRVSSSASTGTTHEGTTLVASDDADGAEEPAASVTAAESAMESTHATEESAEVIDPAEESAESIVTPSPAPYSSMFRGWFGGSGGGDTNADSASSAAEVPPTEVTVGRETNGEVTEFSGPDAIPDDPSEDVTVKTADLADVPTGESPMAPDSKPAAIEVVIPMETNEKEPEPEEASVQSNRKEMSEKDQKALDDAFAQDASDRSAPAPSTIVLSSSPAAKQPTPPIPRPRGLGQIHPDTPIPNADVALLLLRRFAQKTRPKIVSTYGGTKSRGIINYLFGSSKEDPTFTPYRDLLDILYDEGEDRDRVDEDASERLIQGLAGQDGDSMARAKLAMAAFCYLFSQWGHVSSQLLEQKNAKHQQAFSELLAASLDTASLLVAHGCWDGVVLGIGPHDDALEYFPAVHMLAQSVFNSDLTIERNELAAMKFLLSTGCRVPTHTDAITTSLALLRGSHLLQTIRVLYHVYLTTESMPNKTTARAALQQLVTSVFNRVVISDNTNHKVDNFPSEAHRDAFLVLRSICKLSMRTLPDPSTGMHSHVGLQASGSNDTWDGAKDSVGMSSTTGSGGTAQDGVDAEHRETAHLVYTSAIHPALESKILALELLLYVLQNISFSREFIKTSGPQFHAAIRNYLCVSLLKNCLSDNTRVVNLSLRIFVPLVRSFRSILKTEIEAFVTNVFFVILDSKNSPVEHQSLVVNTFDEICSDPTTLADIFLNYDCDLSAVDLFHRIVNTLSKMARAGVKEPKGMGSMSFMGGRDAARMEKFRNENRELRLNAMKALRQVLASLHASIVEPMPIQERAEKSVQQKLTTSMTTADDGENQRNEEESSQMSEKQNLVEVYGSKKKRRAEESEVIVRFNQKPSAGIAYAAQCGHIDPTDAVEVAAFLLKNKDVFEKTQIGEYLGREVEYQGGFSLKVLHQYVRLLDFAGLEFDDAIRFFLSGFRLPGEAQKIDRIMEKFAERFTEQNPEVFPSADVAFILAFSIIMLNTDLHNPAIKEERRMTKDGFIRNNRGICDGQDLPEELLTGVFDRIQNNPISLKEDDEARERVGESKNIASIVNSTALNPASFFSSHYDDMDRARETNFQKERDHIVRTTETLLKRRRHFPADSNKSTTKQRKSPRQTSRFVRTEDTGLCDEYVSPMFEVTWGPALAAFSTAMESANGTVGSLIAIASDDELELAAENAAETIEVCLTGFRFAVGIAGLCGNNTARDAFMLALGRFSQLGTGVLLEPRHVRCIQTLLSLAREDGELLGSSWEHVFKALSEINRFHQIFQLMARNDRSAAAAAERRRRRMEEKETKRRERELRRTAAEGIDTFDESTDDEYAASEVDSLAESELFSDEDNFEFEEDMDAKAVDEANARLVYEAVSEAVIEAIYERSSSLSAPAVKDFVSQLCHVSNLEISVGIHTFQPAGGDAANNLTQVSYRQQHALLSSHTGVHEQFHHSQPNIYNLQKLVEVTHYNMDKRPRLIFAELWVTVADHLTATALHSNPALAMYAVDSFRQLSIQYLKRDELEVFEFQKRFLKPLETVMARSSQLSTKELLLDCIARVVQVFDSERSTSNLAGAHNGGLRSGWLPILAILGQGGRDHSAKIAEISFDILTLQVEKSARENDCGVLLGEYFVEAVNAMTTFLEGPHEQLAIRAIDEFKILADFLGNDRAVSYQCKKGTMSVVNSSSPSQRDLELWWPMLLGLSRSVGDIRLGVRTKGLDGLIDIIESYFIPDGPILATDSEDFLQTLQLVFRGILIPMLEFAEIGSEEGLYPPLPEDFEHCGVISQAQHGDFEEAGEEIESPGWVETTFEQFLDACISICNRSISVFQNDLLVEEIFAILNSCLLSDYGSLSVRGLRRLEQFVVSDLDSSVLTDDSWATVSHMLRRCLSVRGIPWKRDGIEGCCDMKSPTNGGEYVEAAKEFVREERMLPDRRFIGSNAAMVIGQLLSSDQFSKALGLRWRLFLVSGLGKGIAEWDHAATLIEQYKPTGKEPLVGRPEYFETALYGRKWMNRFLLNLATMPEVAAATADSESESNNFLSAQHCIVDETKRLLDGFLNAEKKASEYRHTTLDELVHARFTVLVTELLSGFNHMETEHLKNMSWISPTLLGSCIQSKNESIRSAVQTLVQRTSHASQAPYPKPGSKHDDDESTNVTQAGILLTCDKDGASIEDTQQTVLGKNESITSKLEVTVIDADNVDKLPTSAGNVGDLEV